MNVQRTSQEPFSEKPVLGLCVCSGAKPVSRLRKRKHFLPFGDVDCSPLLVASHSLCTNSRSQVERLSSQSVGISRNADVKDLINGQPQRCFPSTLTLHHPFSSMASCSEILTVFLLDSL
jgi:hypothetical protein